MAIATTLRQFLKQRGIPYDVVAHPRSVTSMETAAAAHVPGDQLAKAVVLEDEQGYLLAVLPSTHRLELGSLHQRLHRNLGLATESEVTELFRDCDTGAIPPTGNAYGVETIVDERLAEMNDVYFEAGDHEELIHVSGDQFRALMEGAGRAQISRHV